MELKARDTEAMNKDVEIDTILQIGTHLNKELTKLVVDIWQVLNAQNWEFLR